VIAHDLRETIVDEPRQLDRHGRLFDMRTRRGQTQELRHAKLVDDSRAIGNVAMTEHGDVVVARVVQPRVPIIVDRDLHAARAGAERVEVSGGIEVIVEVDDHRDQK
jgi:hypothetical protein